MNTVHYSASPVTKVDLVPSSSLVEERLKELRIERMARLEAFRKEVEAAKIEWEAELLLALEELQESGGFVELEEKIKKDITLEQQNKRHRGIISVIPSSPSIVQRTNDPANKLRSEIFLPDVLDIQQATSLLIHKHHNVPLFRVGDPTLLTERADFRIQFLSSVMQQLYKNINTLFEKQDAEDRALLEEQRKIQERLRMAQQRHRKMGISYPMEEEIVMPVRR